MKGRRSTKIGIRVRTIKSRKSHRASPPTFRSAISLTCRLSQYHWLSSWRSKQTRITFRATGEHTPANGSQRGYQCPLQALREVWGGGGTVGTNLHMHVHMHTHTPKSHNCLLYQSPNAAGKEGNLLIIKASGSGLQVLFPKKFSYFTPKLLCIFLLKLPLSLPAEFFCLPGIQIFWK